MMMESIRSITIDKIKRKNLPFNDSLPVLDKKTLRKMESVWPRIITLGGLKSLAECPEDRIEILNWLDREQLMQFLSKREKEILSKGTLTKQDVIDLSWYQESLYAMLWAVGIVKEMMYPSMQSDVLNYLRQIPPDVSIDSFKESLSLRTEVGILQELDYYYNLHWIVKRFDNELNESVVMERRKALEWICDCDNDWDDVDLNT